MAATAHVWVVSPNNTVKPPFRRVFDALNQRSGVDGSSVDFHTSLVHKVDQVRGALLVVPCVCVCACVCVSCHIPHLWLVPPSQAWRGVSAVLSEYQSARRGPAIIVAQTLIPKPTLFHLMPGTVLPSLRAQSMVHAAPRVCVCVCVCSSPQC